MVGYFPFPCIGLLDLPKTLPRWTGLLLPCTTLLALTPCGLWNVGWELRYLKFGVWWWVLVLLVNGWWVSPYITA